MDGLMLPAKTQKKAPPFVSLVFSFKVQLLFSSPLSCGVYVSVAIKWGWDKMRRCRRGRRGRDMVSLEIRQCRMG